MCREIPKFLAISHGCRGGSPRGMRIAIFSLRRGDLSRFETGAVHACRRYWRSCYRLPPATRCRPEASTAGRPNGEPRARRRRSFDARRPRYAAHAPPASADSGAADRDADAGAANPHPAPRRARRSDCGLSAARRRWRRRTHLAPGLFGGIGEQASATPALSQTVPILPDTRRSNTMHADASKPGAIALLGKTLRSGDGS